MSGADRNRAKGVVDQMKGRVEQAMGRLTGNPERRVRGAAEEAKGKVEQGIGNLRARLARASEGNRRR